MKLLEVLTKGSQKQVEDYISQRFIQNMEFFKRTSKGLFEELKLPPKSYNLMLDSHGINIMDLGTNTPIYPILDGKGVMLETHLEISTSPLKNPRWKIHSNEVFLMPLDAKKLPITGEVVNNLIELLGNRGGIKDYHLHPKFMPSTILYGLFGGLFLAFLVDEGVFFHSLLLFEEHVDLFRIACYFIDFAKLFDSVSDGACYLFVKDIANQKFIRNFFASRKITSNFLLCELQMYSSPKIAALREAILQEYSANKRGWGSFEDEMIGIQNTLANQKTPIFAKPKRLDAPICVVGNGASLDSLLPFIKANEDKMLILSCGTALKPLKNHGIQVDFQIEIERIDYLIDVLRDAPLGETPLFCGNMVNPSALNLAKEKYLFLRGGSSGSYLFDGVGCVELGAPFVGNAGVALAMHLGSEILLCGIDCAYIEGEAKHAKSSYYGDERAHIPPDATPVRGNKDKKTFADSVFLLSLQNIIEAIRVYQPRLVLNLGDGAYIEGARSACASEVRLAPINKPALIEQIKDSMRQGKLKAGCVSEARAYIHEVCEVLKGGARSKRELFALTDRVFALMVERSARDPHLGILFEGSLGHMLQNLLLASLHLPHDDILVFYAQGLEIIKLGLEKMLLRYSLLLGLGFGGDAL